MGFGILGATNPVAALLLNQLDTARKAADSKVAEAQRQANQAKATQYVSDNNDIVSLAQIHSQEFTLQQTGLDREMQNAANLELGIERLDTSLQTSKLSYIEQMSQEENRHIEKVAQMKAVSSGHTEFPAISSGDFPMPGNSEEGR